jgi:hypothetical protein
MVDPVIVGNVKSGAFAGLKELQLGELQLSVIPQRARIAIIRVSIINRILNILLAILVTSWYKSTEIL